MVEVPQLINFETFADLAMAAMSAIMSSSIGIFVAIAIIIKALFWMRTMLQTGGKSYLERYNEKAINGYTHVDADMMYGLQKEGFTRDRNGQLQLRRGYQWDKAGKKPERFQPKRRKKRDKFWD